MTMTDAYTAPPLTGMGSFKKEALGLVKRDASRQLMEVRDHSVTLSVRDKQDFQPWGEDGKTPIFEICGCCGVDFGYQDCTVEHVKKFREEWLRKGAKWADRSEKPDNWSLEEQLKNIPKKYH